MRITRPTFDFENQMRKDMVAGIRTELMLIFVNAQLSGRFKLVLSGAPSRDISRDIVGTIKCRIALGKAEQRLTVYFRTSPLVAWTILSCLLPSHIKKSDAYEQITRACANIKPLEAFLPQKNEPTQPCENEEARPVYSPESFQYLLEQCEDALECESDQQRQSREMVKLEEKIKTHVACMKASAATQKVEALRVAQAAYDAAMKDASTLSELAKEIQKTREKESRENAVWTQLAREFLPRMQALLIE